MGAARRLALPNFYGTFASRGTIVASSAASSKLCGGQIFWI